MHLYHPPVRRWQIYLEERLAEQVRLTYGPELPAAPEYEVLVAGRPSRAALEASPRLQTLVIPWAGLPEETRALLGDFPQLTVYNLHHNATFVAEMTLALLLAAAKHLLPPDRALRRHDWTPRYGPNPAVHLAGKRALILGYGAIGQRVARLCRCLGMEVHALRHRVRPGDDPAFIHPPEALDALLPRSDVLIVALPHTEETTGLIGAPELARLPARAILVNVARGPIVDEEALFVALRDGTLHAAAIDVWYNYPAGKDAGYGVEEARVHTPPSTYPFHDLDNVVLSPHRAGGLGTDAVEEARVHDLAELLNALARGEAPSNRVRVERGY
ncbi:MAG: NAD(P)-dependent oxidoreductase [Anaerolineales bacterium]